MKFAINCILDQTNGLYVEGESYGWSISYKDATLFDNCEVVQAILRINQNQDKMDDLWIEPVENEEEWRKQLDTW